MPVQSFSEGDELYHIFDLADPNLELDLTSDPWNLAVGQASEIVGLDVVHTGRLAPDGGRKPIGLAHPDSGALVSAAGSGMYGSVGVRFRDIFNATDYTGTTTTLRRDTVFSGTSYAWPADMVGAIIYQNADGRSGPAYSARIMSISTDAETDDTLNFEPALTTDWVAASFDKISIVYPSTFDKRGIWVTNGRKFWLLQGAAWQQYLDLGSDDYLGETWRVARIAVGLVMFTNPHYPARIVHLSDGATTDATGNAALAGLITPTKPEPIETAGDDDGNENKSWNITVGKAGAAGGELENADAGDSYRVMVRAVNLEDSAESKFVPAYGTVQIDERDIATYDAAGTDDGYLSVHQRLNNDALAAPPLHERWTHIEVWRTTNNGANYYLERRIEIARLANESDDAAILNTLVEETPANQYTCVLSDTALAGQTQMTAADLLAGHPPPICQEAVSLGGVTICMGKADSDAEDVIAYSRNFYAEGSEGFTYDHHGNAAGERCLDGLALARYAGYEYTAGDQLVITANATDDNENGTYDIGSRPNTNDLLLTTHPTKDLAGVSAYIRRPYTIEWPKIESDEQVHYSRTDKFAPESFPARTFSLSRQGDTFRRLVRVGNYAAVIMTKAVHLLYLSGTSLLWDTVGSDGDGTPWADSVVVLRNLVLWATPGGIKVLSTSNGVNDQGHRGVAADLDKTGRFRAWFQAAFDNGETVDAGVDTHSECVRWRREISSNEYQVLQWSYRTNRWTLLDDDNGFAYAPSTYAESSALSADRLYSVTGQGNVFLVNHDGEDHPYDGKTVQDTIDTDDGYTVTTTWIMKANIFRTSMLGDTIRFRSDTASVDGQSRVITTATINNVNFDAVPGLANGDTFIIGATRFKLKWAPLRGRFRSALQTLTRLLVRAVKGPRNTDNADWDDPPTGAFTLKAYREFGGSAADTNTREIGIFDERDVDKTTDDRVSSLEAQGSAITLELSLDDSRSDFRLELVEAVLRDESDVRGDTSIAE